MDGRTDKRSEALDISSFTHTTWTRDGNESGTISTGTLTIPGDITPGAVLMRYTGKPPQAEKPDANRARCS